LGKILKFFDVDPASGMEKFESGMGKIWIRNPGWKKFGSGINIPDPNTGTAICPSVS
jgi:hypothetical protein